MIKNTRFWIAFAVHKAIMSEGYILVYWGGPSCLTFVFDWFVWFRLYNLVSFLYITLFTSLLYICQRYLCNSDTGESHPGHLLVKHPGCQGKVVSVIVMRIVLISIMRSVVLLIYVFLHTDVMRIDETFEPLDYPCRAEKKHKAHNLIKQFGVPVLIIEPVWTGGPASWLNISKTLQTFWEVQRSSSNVWVLTWFCDDLKAWDWKCWSDDGQTDRISTCRLNPFGRRGRVKASSQYPPWW